MTYCQSQPARRLAWLLFSAFLTASLPTASLAQTHYHTPPQPTHPLMVGQEQQTIPRLLITSGDSQPSQQEWLNTTRPALLKQWQQILGKLEPAPEDEKWFGDVTQVQIISREQKETYERIELRIPIEKDFYQNHLLLIPHRAKQGPCPAVICWTSTSPDYRAPEAWWGEWLAEQGFVVLTSWSFIRNYRDDTSFRNEVQKKVYDRFGRWAPMGKMVHDVEREVEYLRTLEAVDAERIGFMGFSLSAKSALYVAAFCEDIKATVSIDPHLAIYGDSNYLDPWYLDARTPFDSIPTNDYPDPKLRGTVWSLLDRDPQTPGFEHNHHELLALTAPRAIQIIGCSTDKPTAPHSDDRQSQAYVDAAQPVFDLLKVGNRLVYTPLTCGHKADHPDVAAAWQPFILRQLAPSQLSTNTPDQ